MNIKKISAATFASVMLLTSLSSCSSDAVMTYGKYSISENEFMYYLATYKARYAQTYSDFKNTHEYFSQVIGEDGSTAEEILYSAVIHNVKMTLVS
ncbi:MAG: hypothetical protein ACI4XJ_06070, partial [Eubacteriales bacterium]